jgi:predicted nucleic acid-binding protein
MIAPAHPGDGDVRVVFDTGVVLQATLNGDGPAARTVALMEQGRVAAYVSNRLRSEYETTLTNPHIRAKF